MRSVTVRRAGNDQKMIEVWVYLEEIQSDEVSEV